MVAESFIDFDGDYSRGAFRQLRRQRSEACSDLDHCIGRGQPGSGSDSTKDAAIGEEVLSEAFPSTKSCRRETAR
jgi:hypothetical protein